MITIRISDLTQDFLEKHEDFSIYPGYAGQESSPYGVIVGNWNNVPQVEQDNLEARGIERAWSDMVTSCDDCGLLIEIQPTHSHWVMQAKMDLEKGSILCLGCAKDQEES